MAKPSDLMNATKTSAFKRAETKKKEEEVPRSIVSLEEHL
jgi:hypothetical protein